MIENTFMNGAAFAFLTVILSIIGGVITFNAAQAANLQDEKG